MGRKAKYATQRKYQPYIDIIMDDLGLTGKVTLDWVFGTYTSMGGDATLYGSAESTMPRYGKVRLDKHQSHAWTITAIMHELRHIQQRLTDRLSGGYHKMIITRRGKSKYIPMRKWDGVEYQHYSLSRYGQPNPEYLALPWEQDARVYEEEIKRLFPGNKLPQKKEKELIGVVGKVKFYKIAS